MVPINWIAFPSSPMEFVRILFFPFNLERGANKSLALAVKEAAKVLEVVKSASAKDGPLLGHFGEKYQSDNGSEYINKEFTDFMEKINAVFAHGNPYTPQTQGQVRIISLLLISNFLLNTKPPFFVSF